MPRNLRSPEHLTRDVIAIGAITGVRMFAGPNVAAHLNTNRPLYRARRGVAALAGWEVFADKALPLPPRTNGASLLGRAAAGAVSGWLLSRRARFALLGAVSAIAAAYVVVSIRRVASAAVPDFLLGLAEDALVIATQSSIAASRR
jgi:hypothetical protein